MKNNKWGLRKDFNKGKYCFLIIVDKWSIELQKEELSSLYRLLVKIDQELSSIKSSLLDEEFINLENNIPIIAIPTTAGTGSEVTKFTIITNEKTDEKMLCVGPAFMPIAAIVDYELTYSVPQRTTADTAIDSLTHAIEAFVSKKSNLFSDTQAISAMELIAPNIRRAYNNGKDQEAREKLMTGATLAGIAFSNSSVALVHGMSRPIGAFYHVPHGLSNAMLLPTVTEFSIPAAPERYSKCAKAIGIANNYCFGRIIWAVRTRHGERV